MLCKFYHNKKIKHLKCQLSKCNKATWEDSCSILLFRENSCPKLCTYDPVYHMYAPMKWRSKTSPPSIYPSPRPSAYLVNLTLYPHETFSFPCPWRPWSTFSICVQLLYAPLMSGLMRWDWLSSLSIMSSSFNHMAAGVRMSCSVAEQGPPCGCPTSPLSIQPPMGILVVSIPGLLYVRLP